MSSKSCAKKKLFFFLEKIERYVYTIIREDKKTREKKREIDIHFIVIITVLLKSSCLNIGE